MQIKVTRDGETHEATLAPFWVLEQQHSGRLYAGAGGKRRLLATAEEVAAALAKHGRVTIEYGDPNPGTAEVVPA